MPTRAPEDRDPDVEGFLALLAARRAPKTVEAYRRDLTQLGAYLGKPIAKATLEELERYTAQLRADGLSGATIARRTAAAGLSSRAPSSCWWRKKLRAAAVRRAIVVAASPSARSVAV